ncbi:MAG: hypothetical protein M3280_11640 [Actinomycetota bacterium]|nr:hypothetical protein [Actinomycetota bacterium]
MEEREQELNGDEGANGGVDTPGDQARSQPDLDKSPDDEQAPAADSDDAVTEDLPLPTADGDGTGVGDKGDGDAVPTGEPTTPSGGDGQESENLGAGTAAVGLDQASETVDVGTDPGATEGEPETVDVGTDPGATEDEPATEEQQKERVGRSWVPWVVGVPIVVALAVAVVLLLENVDLGGGGDAGGGRLDQPGWRITAYSVGSRFLEDADRKLSSKVRSDLVNLIKRVHNTMFLAPRRIPKMTRQYFLSEAAKALGKSKVGVPRAARQVKMVSRRARIGVDAAGESRAAALVNIVARGRANGKRFKSATEARLWLERNSGEWKVIAFQVDQHPVKLKKKDRGGGGDKAGDKDKKRERGDNSKKGRTR